MLSYALAIIVAISSLVLFFTAFLMSDLHRQDDFLWSGVGLFYALVLWYCAQNITGAVLLGQAAATALLVSSGWQNLQLRRAMQRGLGGSPHERLHQEAIANPEKVKVANTSKFSLSRTFSRLFKRKQKSVESTADTTPAVAMPKVTESEIAIPDTASQSNTPEAAKESTESATSAVANKPSNTVSINQPIAKESGTAERKDLSAKTTVEATEVLQSQDVENSSDQQLPSTDTKTNKISESQPSEAATGTSNAIASSDLQVESKIETEESATVTPKDQSIKPESPATDVKPNTTVTTEINGDQSNLDTLETVEVAEVLEAIPEDQVNNRNNDQSNIIEVTTTEIDSRNQVNNSEHTQEDKINPNS